MVHDAKKATTNMHLDISDAVNVLLNVTVPVGKKGTTLLIVRALTRPVRYDDSMSLCACYLVIRALLVAEGVSEKDLERASANWDGVGALWVIWPPQAVKYIRKYFDWVTSLEDGARAGCGGIVFTY